MPIVTADLSVSLDGYATGPDVSPSAPLGEGGDRLHQWLYGIASWRSRHDLDGGAEDVDSRVVEEDSASTRAVVMGRAMFDLGERFWGDDPPFKAPVFVVTHRPGAIVERLGGTSYTFVTGGIGEAIDLARDAAGDGDVSIAGGPSVVRQAMADDLLDELRLHIVPILLGDGTRLFDGSTVGPRDLTPTRVVEGVGAAHLSYRFR